MGNQCEKPLSPETICGPNTIFDQELNKCTASSPSDFCDSPSTIYSTSDQKCIVRQDCSYGVFSDGECVKETDVKNFTF